MKRLNKHQRSILAAAWSLHHQNAIEFTDCQLAMEDRRLRNKRLMMRYATLCRALAQLVERQLLARRNEDEAVAAAENRARRTFYRITDQGQQAAYAATRDEAERHYTLAPATPAMPAAAFSRQQLT